jgi:plastocyanin
MRLGLVIGLPLLAASAWGAAPEPLPAGATSATVATIEGQVTVAGVPRQHVAILLTGGAPRAPAPARLAEVWLSFVPKVQVVAPGTELVVDNRDEESHTVHAHQGGVSLFNVATVPRGAPSRARLDRPGVVTVTCDIHQEMRAYLLVTSARYAAVSDPDGRFSIGEVPPGEYDLRVWRIGDPGGDPPGTAAGRVLVKESVTTVSLALAERPEEPVLAAAPTASPGIEITVGYRGPARLRTWPSGRLSYRVALLAIGVGLGAAWLVEALGRRRRWHRGTAIACCLSLAIVFGLGSFLGLNGAVAAALFLGTLLGTVGAHLLRAD